jgi:pullulanase
MSYIATPRGLQRLLLAMALLVVLALAAPGARVQADHTPDPATVTLVGDLQSELGCPGDWQPPCEETMLTYDANDDVWQRIFPVPAGDWEYKVALNGSWDENYGAGAQQDGPNIPLELAEARNVKFYYDHKTHWITDNVNSRIVTAPGSYQSEIGCPGDWQPDCLRSWLQDPDGDGIYTFATTGIPAGNYEVKAAINESWSENYGDGGVRDGPNIPFTVPEDGNLVVFSFESETNVLTVDVEGAPTVNLVQARAHWVDAETIAWNTTTTGENISFWLHYAPEGGLIGEQTGVVGGEAIPLTVDPGGLSGAVLAKFPHLGGYAALKLPAEALPMVPEILTGQVVVSKMEGEDNLLDATALQIPGVLDDLYTYHGALGVVWDEGVPTIKVWAPTAKSVTLHVFPDSNLETPGTPIAMVRDDANGVWSAVGDPTWEWQYYHFEVEVFVRRTGQVERNHVTDPYSVSLAMDSTRSQIVNLEHPDLKPEGWDALEKPHYGGPEDIVIYEIHMRDFSVADPSVPLEHKGKYTAFALPDTHGVQHLRALAEAGLTHLHLLPSFDLATIPENPENQVPEDWEYLSQLPPDSEEQQAYINSFRDQNAFNWGYDPFHFNAPEGSYATDPDGPQRILEYRQMVMALNQMGLRFAKDVVYNHTNDVGQGPRSVFDRVVPDYYHRLNEIGQVHTSTCCPNTATEHNMMERFMIDSVMLWATAYKVDSFRFDLMGHHMVENMLNLQDAIATLTPEVHGVDGADIYLYGEGWDFGEVANNARGVNATQFNMAGTGVGTFNDRLRDAVRGGGPFDGGDALVRNQGFINGSFYDPNAMNTGAPAELGRLLHQKDLIRVGLAGNLRDYTFIDRTGTTITGAQVDYNGNPAGYTLDPQENIVYVSKHDNQTLYDINAYKMPLDSTMEERVRAQNMGLSVVALSQGVPFFHAGSDMLRSKSMDRNSYNSGDWFNKLDFTYQHNNWGVGLPLAEDNQENWYLIAPRLRDLPAPGHDHIMGSVHHFREMLQIRQSSKLFRLETAEDVQSRLTFWNTGPDQIPGLIAMTLSDRAGVEVDPMYATILVLLNANDEEVTFQHEALVGLPMMLHPVQINSADPVVRTAMFDPATGAATVPARTTAVFVEPDEPTAVTLAEVVATGAGTGGGMLPLVLATSMLGLTFGLLALRRRRAA